MVLLEREKMKRISLLLSIVFCAIMLTGFSSSPEASADGKSCWLEAKNTVYLSINDLDSLGNILVRLWRGVLAQGDKKLIKSSNGKIRYYTNPNAGASSPGINKTCINNEIIAVP
jgi:uncharacterized membrane protein